MAKALRGRAPRRAAQLDREIAQALATKKRPRWHHATRYGQPYDDAWDVAMDAILEHDPKRAAQIVQDIRAKHGSYEPSTEFEKALDKAPADVRRKFEEYRGVRTAAKHVEAINDAIYRAKDPDALVAAVREANKHVGAMKRLARKPPAHPGSFAGIDSSGEFDPKMGDLGNLLVQANEMVRRIKIQRKTGRLPKPSSRTAWKLRP